MRGRSRGFVHFAQRPLAFPALAAGAVMAWARALGEFGGTIIFAGSFPGVIQTIPLAIFSALESNFDAAGALSVMVLVFAFTVILATRFRED
jgi:molybdate transport system permease protein